MDAAESNDMRKLIRLQNEGKIMRIYTTKMASRFAADLRQLQDRIRSLMESIREG